MVEITGVRFNSAGKVYYFDPKGQKLKVGTSVLVETARGVEMGHIVIGNKNIDDSEVVAPLKPILRVATEEDFAQVKANKEKEKDAFIIANEQIREHGLKMKLVDVEYTFDSSKILFYFTADGRVDFRELVKSLAGIFHTRIELRQIGVRDEARQLGSFGICGRYVCCGTFLDDFKPVSIKMAKEQGLSLNPTKISGVCGRLMCCLQYEQNAYEDMLKRLPSKGTVADTPDGRGIIVDVATLKGEVRVKFDDGDITRYGMYKVEDIKTKGGRYNNAAAEEKDELAEMSEELAALMNEESGEIISAEPDGKGGKSDGGARPNKNKGQRKNKNRRSGRNNKNRGNDAEQNAEKSENGGGKGERRGGYKKFDKRGAKGAKKASDSAPKEKRNTDSRADKTDGE